MLELGQRDLSFRRPHWHTKFFGRGSFGVSTRTPALTCNRRRTGGELNQDIYKTYSCEAGALGLLLMKHFIVIVAGSYKEIHFLDAFSLHSNIPTVARQSISGKTGTHRTCSLHPASSEKSVTSSRIEITMGLNPESRGTRKQIHRRPTCRALNSWCIVGASLAMRLTETTC
jgi:hypothetical protein